MDIISDLPDSIRRYIVSFLSLKDAVRTRVLSKQWRNVCSSLSKLTFHETNFKLETNNQFDFNDFVYQILLLNDGSNVEEFCLHVDVNNSSVQHLNSWISFAVLRNVKHFTLMALLGELKTFLPSCLFTCTSLTVLRLANLKFNLPTNTTISLPVLKILSLNEVKFYDDDQTNRLISSCPVLVRLTFIDCSWTSCNLLIFSGPNLRHLVLWCRRPDPPIPEVNISCTNLHQIFYVGHPLDISLDVLSSCCDAKLWYHTCFLSSNRIEGNIVNERTINVVMGLRNVIKMSLNIHFMKILSKDRDLLLQLPSSCCRLKVLHLDIYPTKDHVQVLTFLLRSYPRLQTLTLFLYRHPFYDTLNKEGFWQSEGFSMEGILNHLKTVNLDWFEGSDSELDLVRYLAEKANILEKINIIYSDKLEEDYARQASIAEKLMQFNKASPCATYHLQVQSRNPGSRSMGALKQTMIYLSESLGESDWMFE